MKVYNIYCDESCHLERDGNDIMVLGCISCPIEFVKESNIHIRKIKQKHNIDPGSEIKWTKVSNSKIEMYLELIDYFFNSYYLNFRAVIAVNKSKLDHETFNQDHDSWYYKMYYLLLKYLIEVEDKYRIYIDIKDTRGMEKIDYLHRVLSNSLYDFYNETIERIQLVRSDEIQLLQLTDLIIGSLSYVNRKCSSSSAKLQIIEKIRKYTGLSLMHKTPKDFHKFNIFVWDALYHLNQRR
ncbi:MAG: hypothetical protein BWX97_00082 [Firmicutes bacterium ADurb.Bin146]|nr:MAG: hypothetical protein BWX97_00082 [Firmicutes bacterium ADurb.Bin146]